MSFLAVALGGALGALLRYFISLQMADSPYYYTTFVVNILGCLLFGVVWVASDQLLLNETLRLFISVGLLGSLTTFSTFSIDIIQLINQGQWLYAVTYVILSLVAGVAVMFFTIAITKQLF